MPTAKSHSPASTEAAPPRPLSHWMTLLLAAACGLIVANIYYAQPLAGPISRELGLAPAAAGLIVTMTQVGYGLGLLFIVPLGDLFENRRLILSIMSIAVAALLTAALSSHPWSFLAAALFIGIGSVAVQVIVPFAAHLAPAGQGGRVVGDVMSGLALGIMLARPAASFIANVSSWHVVFYVSTGLMLVLGLVLSKTLPSRVPVHNLSYGRLLASMARMVLDTPLLRRRALYQACLFGAFSLFWTTTPLLLAAEFHLTQAGIAWFALAGVAGAIAAPIGGRLADRGLVRPATGVAIACAGTAFLLTHLAPAGSHLALGLLVAAAILLDFGVAGNLTLGQRTLFALGAASRSRMNGLFMAAFFFSGAAGSALGAWSYAHGGWTLTSWCGFALPALALLFYSTEFKRKTGPASQG